MNETKLLRICLIVAATGIIILFFLAQNLEARTVSLSEITPDLIGQSISVSAIVSKISVKEGMTFMLLKQHDQDLSVVFFQEISSVASGDNILISGKVQEYKGRLQIVGEKYSENEEYSGRN